MKAFLLITFPIWIALIVAAAIFVSNGSVATIAWWSGGTLLVFIVLWWLIFSDIHIQ